MPDVIRTSVDLSAKPAEVYAYVTEPSTSPMIAHAREVVDVKKDDSHISGFTTKRGTVKYVTFAPPHFLEGEYQQQRARARYDIRFEAIGDTRTRVSIDVNIQPQGLRAKMQGPLPRLRVKSQLNDWLEQVQQHFTVKK